MPTTEQSTLDLERLEPHTREPAATFYMFWSEPLERQAPCVLFNKTKRRLMHHNVIDLKSDSGSRPSNAHPIDVNHLTCFTGHTRNLHRHIGQLDVQAIKPLYPADCHIAADRS